MGEAAVPRALHGALPRLVDRPDPHRDPLLVQRGPVPLDGPGLVPSLVLGRPGPLRPPRPRSPARRSCRACGSPRSPCSSPCRSGVALAIGLTRWRGRGSGTARGISLATLVTPEIVMGTALLLVFVHLLTFIQLGTVGAGDRAHHVLPRLRRDHRPGAPARDRAGVRGGSARPRRVTHPGVAARAAADARPGDRGERDHRLRDLDGRLRHQRVPVVRHRDRHGARSDLLDGPHRSDARAERPRDADARHHHRHRARRIPALARRARRTRPDRLDCREFAALDAEAVR